MQVAAVNVHPAATAQVSKVGEPTPAHVVAVVVDAAVHVNVTAAVKMQRLTLRQLVSVADADKAEQ
jgi:hypothetical protein